MAEKNFEATKRIFLDKDGKATTNARKGVVLFAIPGQKIPPDKAKEVGLSGDSAGITKASSSTTDTSPVGEKPTNDPPKETTAKKTTAKTTAKKTTRKKSARRRKSTRSKKA